MILLSILEFLALLEYSKFCDCYPMQSYVKDYYASHESHRRQRPIDLTIPSYAYVPERYTGHMQYLTNQPIFSAEDLGGYILNWTKYQSEFREPNSLTIPPPEITDNPLIPLPIQDPSGDSSPFSASLTQLQSPSIATEEKIQEQSGKNSAFKPCASKNSFGVCVDDVSLSKICIGKVATKSVICTPVQSCCIDSMPNTLSISVLTSTGTGSRFSTTSNLTVPNTNLGTLASELTSLPKAKPPPAGAGSKVFRPCLASFGKTFGATTVVGICVNRQLVGTFCLEKSVSRSPNCEATQLCCADSSNLDSLPLATLAPNVQAITVQSTSATTTKTTTALPQVTSDIMIMPKQNNFQQCIPTLQESSQIGTCIDESLLGELCIDQFISTSTNCGPSQSCCVSKPPEADAVTDIPIANDLSEFLPSAQPVSIPLESDLVLVKNIPSNGLIRHRQTARFESCKSPELNLVGKCIPNQSVTVFCAGKFVLPSPQCSQLAHSCCFEPPRRNSLAVIPVQIRKSVTTTVQPPQMTFVSCTSAEDWLLNGICVDNQLVAELCDGKVAQGSDCPSVQSCCIKSDETNSDHLQLPVIPDPLKISSKAVAPPQTTFVPCNSPDDILIYGICVDNLLIGEICGGKTIAKRSDCPVQQSCCFDDSVQRLVTSTPLLEPVTSHQTTFIPCNSADDSLIRGICVDNKFVGETCGGKTIARRSSCPTQQLCCFDRSTDLTAGNSVENELLPKLAIISGSPDRELVLASNPSDPLIRHRQSSAKSRFESCASSRFSSLGKCIPNKSVTELCAGKVISSSSQCRQSTHSCCFDVTRQNSLALIPARSVTLATTTTTTTTIIPPQATFLPCASADDEFSNGICVDNQLVTETCDGKVIARRSDCPFQQSCCTDPKETNLRNKKMPADDIAPMLAKRLPQTSFAPCTSVDQGFSNGICVDNQLVTETCNGKVIVRQSDCPVQQSCCTDRNEAKVRDHPAPGIVTSTLSFLPAQTSFVPCLSSRSLFEDGICVNDELTSSLCSGKFISKSRSCPVGQTCCVDDSSNLLPVGARQMEVAIPSTTRQPILDLSTRKSVFMPLFQECVPIIPNFKTGVCVDEADVSRVCFGRLVAPSRFCAVSQSCCSYFPQVVAPVPPSTPSVLPQRQIFLRKCFVNNSKNGPHSGVCIETMSAMDYCAGKVLTVSDICSDSQLCCANSDK